METTCPNDQDGYCVKHQESYQGECGPCNKELREAYERGKQEGEYMRGFDEGFSAGFKTPHSA